MDMVKPSSRIEAFQADSNRALVLHSVGNDSVREAGEVFSSIDALPVRIRNIATLRGLGYSFREIGRQLGVTPQAVSLMLSRHRRSLKEIKGSVELACLSARAVNALGRHGVRTREEARKSDLLARLGDERNCGSKTLEELRRWMEEDSATPPQPRRTSGFAPEAFDRTRATAKDAH